MKPSFTRVVAMVAVLLSGYTSLQAQTLTIGAGAQSGTSSNGATGDPGPMYKSTASSSFDYSRHHYLYTQAELSSAGLTNGSVISKLAWYKANNAASNGNFHFQIWMKNSSLTAVQSPSQSWSNLTSGSTQVYNTNAQTMSSTIGFMEFNLSTPFVYTGGAIEISVHYDCSMVSGNAFTAGISWKKDPITNRTISQCGSSNSTTLNNARTVRPQIRMTYTSCTAPSGLAVSGITATSANITWNTVSGSQGYQYVVDQTAAVPTGAGTPTNTASASAGPLQQNTTYYVHVRNKCGSTNFSPWVTAQFTTLTSCFPPTNIVASGLTASTGTISWVNPAITNGYEYKIDQVSTSPVSGFLPTATPVVNFTGHTGGQTYYAHVRNVCAANDKSNWITQSFVMPECNKPVNVIISNVSDSSAHVLWSMMNGSNGYEYAVDFSNQPPNTGTQTTSSIAVQLGGLQPNSKYYFHLRSNCFVSDKSSWRLDSFVTLIGCYAPVVQVNHLGTDNPYAFWNEIPTAIGYEYAVNTSSIPPAFGADIYTTFVSPTLEKDGLDYYLHVRAKCNSMFTTSDWSTVLLRKDATSVPGLVGAGVSVYPNPARDVLHVDGTGEAGYTLLNVAGQEVATGMVRDGMISLRTLPAGVYLLKLDSERQEHIRIVKQ